VTENWKKASKWAGGAVAVITTLAGLIGGAQQIVGFFSSLFKTALEKQVIVETKHFKVVPVSLINTIGSQDYLYWFHLKAQNKTDRPVSLTLSLTPINAPIPEASRNTTLTLKGNESISRMVNPEIKLLHLDDPQPLQVNLRTLVDLHPLSGDLVSISLLPRNEVDWALQSPDGQPLPREFLLASLTAWIQAPEDNVKALAKQLFAGVDVNLEFPALVRKWIEQCYNLALRDHTKLKLRPPEGGFPPRGQQTINTPGEVLESGSASPLEATLLVAAMTRVVRGRYEGRFAMVVLPENGASGELRDYYLAWLVAGLDDWEAIGISRAPSTAFRENLAAATTRIRGLFRGNQDLVQRLGDSGAFIQDNVPVVALDFNAAKRKYNVRGLP
jgi:hypothetical protein